MYIFQKWKIDFASVKDQKFHSIKKNDIICDIIFDDEIYIIIIKNKIYLTRNCILEIGKVNIKNYYTNEFLDIFNLS